MKKIFVIILLFTSFKTLADLEIKGIKVDKAADCNHISSLETRSGQFHPACKSGNSKWMHKISFLGDEATLLISQTSERFIESISVHGFDYDKGLISLEEKFGKPKIESTIVQNRMGASFKQQQAIWNDGEVTMALKKHAGKLNQPSLMLFGQKFSKKHEEESQPSNDL